MEESKNKVSQEILQVYLQYKEQACKTCVNKLYQAYIQQKEYEQNVANK